MRSRRARVQSNRCSERRPLGVGRDATAFDYNGAIRSGAVVRSLALFVVGGAVGAVVTYYGSSQRGGDRGPARLAATTSLDLRSVSRLVSGRLPRSRGGHLAYVGRDGNVYVVDPSGGATVRLTDDRSSAESAQGAFYSGLAWSRTGELAFTRTDPQLRRSILYVTVPGSGKVRRVSRSLGVLIYASWSPTRCGDLSCSSLAYMATSPKAGGKVTLTVLQFPTRSPARPVLRERARQIYFSWAGSLGRMVVHRFLSPGSRLEEHDLATGATTALRASFAPFLAPAFLAGRVVYALPDSPGGRATVARLGSAIVVRVPRETRRVAFAASPDGRRLAFAVRLGPGRTPDGAFGQPQVVDLASGKVVPVGPPTLWTKAFYWAPDSGRLAYLTWLDTDFSMTDQWRVFDVASETDRGFVAFEPTPTFDVLTTFFDQFAQSHRLWSPDGRYLTYAAVSPEGRQQVWLLDTERQPGQLTLVADGVVGAFSWR